MKKNGTHVRNEKEKKESDMRKEKNFPTGIKVNPAKEKKQDREADKKVAEILANFVVPGGIEERRKQAFSDTVAEWLAIQKISKPL